MTPGDHTLHIPKKYPQYASEPSFMVPYLKLYGKLPKTFPNPNFNQFFIN